MNNEHSNALVTAFRLFLSIPIALGWVIIFCAVYAGWGQDKADKMIGLWNRFCAEDDDASACSCNKDRCGCG